MWSAHTGTQALSCHLPVHPACRFQGPAGTGAQTCFFWKMDGFLGGKWGHLQISPGLLMDQSPICSRNFLWFWGSFYANQLLLPDPHPGATSGQDSADLCPHLILPCLGDGLSPRSEAESGRQDPNSDLDRDGGRIYGGDSISRFPRQWLPEVQQGMEISVH